MTYSDIKGHIVEYDDEKGEWEYQDKKWDPPTLAEMTHNLNGHKFYYDPDTNEYRYCSSGKIIERSCKRCREFSTPEGYDYCLDNLGPKVMSACCGHGCHRGFIKFTDGRIFLEVTENEYKKLWDTQPGEDIK